MLDEAATDSNKNIARAIGSTCGDKRLARKRRLNDRMRYSRRDTHFIESLRILSNRLRQRSRGAHVGSRDILRCVHARPRLAPGSQPPIAANRGASKRQATAQDHFGLGFIWGVL